MAERVGIRVQIALCFTRRIQDKVSIRMSLVPSVNSFPNEYKLDLFFINPLISCDWKIFTPFCRKAQMFSFFFPFFSCRKEKFPYGYWIQKFWNSKPLLEFNNPNRVFFLNVPHTVKIQHSKIIFRLQGWLHCSSWAITGPPNGYYSLVNFITVPRRLILTAVGKLSQTKPHLWRHSTAGQQFWYLAGLPRGEARTARISCHSHQPKKLAKDRGEGGVNRGLI